MLYCWSAVSPVSVWRVSSCWSVSGSSADVSSGTGSPQVLQFAPGGVVRLSGPHLEQGGADGDGGLRVPFSDLSRRQWTWMCAAVRPVGTAMLDAVPTTAVAADAAQRARVVEAHLDVVLRAVRQVGQRVTGGGVRAARDVCPALRRLASSRL